MVKNGRAQGEKPRSRGPARPKLTARASVYSIYEYLRELILSGKLAAGATLSQAAIARDVGTSRTPVREAMKMLQNEKLIAAEPNNKARVLPCTLDELGAIYAARIFLEPLGVALSVPRMTNEHLLLLDRRIHQLETAESNKNFGEWIREHTAFHAELSFFAGSAFRSEISNLLERSARFQHLYRASKPNTWTIQRRKDHRDLLTLCRKREASKAYALMIEHLAETSLTVEDYFSSDTGRPQGSPIQMAIGIMRRSTASFDANSALSGYRDIFGNTPVFEPNVR